MVIDYVNLDLFCPWIDDANLLFSYIVDYNLFFH